MKKKVFTICCRPDFNLYIALLQIKNDHFKENFVFLENIEKVGKKLVIKPKKSPFGANFFQPREPHMLN